MVMAKDLAIWFLILQNLKFVSIIKTLKFVSIIKTLSISTKLETVKNLD